MNVAQLVQLFRIRNAIQAGLIGGFAGLVASSIVVWIPVTSLLLQAVLFVILLVVVFLLSAFGLNVIIALQS